MKILPFKIENTEEKQKIIKIFENNASDFLAIYRKEGQYKFCIHGFSNEQLIYIAELIKMNVFDGVFDGSNIIEE